MYIHKYLDCNCLYQLIILFLSILFYSTECTDTIAGVAVGCLSLSLLLTAASVVITFLCTKRCYNKKSSPPSPTLYGEARNDVQQLETVQLQPSPAYQPFAFT